MYSCDFCRSVGAGRATTRNTRGLTRSVIALMVPPLPAPSRPSNTIMIRRPSALTLRLQPLQFLHKLLTLELGLLVVVLSFRHRTSRLMLAYFYKGLRSVACAISVYS